MEDYEKRLLEAIDADVRSNADLIEQMVNQETDALKEDQVTFFAEGLKKETETYLEGELKDLRTYAATKSSKDKMDTKKKLLELRASYVAELFDGVKSELKAFVTSAEYETYLKKNLAKISVSKEGYFCVKAKDVELMQKVLKEAGLANEVREDYLSIGGFRYVDETIRTEYSCVLGDKRDELRTWFRDASGFKIEESEAGE